MYNYIYTLYIYTVSCWFFTPSEKIPIATSWYDAGRRRQLPVASGSRWNVPPGGWDVSWWNPGDAWSVSQWKGLHGSQTHCSSQEKIQPKITDLKWRSQLGFKRYTGEITSKATGFIPQHTSTLVRFPGWGFQVTISSSDHFTSWLVLDAVVLIAGVARQRPADVVIDWWLVILWWW